MVSERWTLRNHGKGTSRAVIAGGRRRIHTTFEDGVEMVEEYTQDGVPMLLVRRWKAPTALGGDGKWEFEIGEANTPDTKNQDIGIALSSTAPIFLCREDTEHWEWRVRNLPYPKENYSVTVEEETQSIVIRTSNKKYFKRFQIPAMIREGHRLDLLAIDFSHSNNTLIVKYQKPDIVIEQEQKLQHERLATASSNEPGCRQQ
ncbi:DPCD isoform X1 [Thraustotheca clavata]|uniref:Protein DPCD n=1 Tax=Thraustotheca clavata TaxID=74557 RepID=A0A1W0A6N5_9STRA|nr:DPCD isoform X1 [Thraustotheca clavata]